MADYTQPEVVHKRVRFFDGQFLADQDLVDEQRYHLDRQRRLPTLVGLQGVVHGLGVVRTGTDRLTVGAGLAVDGRGRQLLVEADLDLVLPSAHFRGAADVELHLAYDEVESDVAVTGGRSARRFHERPKLVATAPDDTVAVAPDSALPTADGPTVLLGTFSVSATGEVTIDVAAVRPAGLSVAGDVGIGSPDPEPDGFGRVLDVLGAEATKLSVRTPTVDGRVLAHDRGVWGGRAGMVVGTATEHPLQLATHGRTRLTVDEIGTVGIAGDLRVGPLDGDGSGRRVEVRGTDRAEVHLRTPVVLAQLTAQDYEQWGARVGVVLGTRSAHPLSLMTDGAARLSVDEAGNVGIGNAWPTARLEVVGGGGSSVDLLVNGRIRSDSDDGGLWVSDDRFVGGHDRDKLGLWNGGWRLTVTGAGQVGIGTTTPNTDGFTASAAADRVVDVVGTAHTRLSVRTGTVDGRVMAHDTAGWGAAAGMTVGTASNHALGLVTRAVTRLAIDAAGAVGIGGSLTVGTTLDVTGNVGIGTSRRDAKLTVAGGGGSTVDLHVTGRIRSDSDDGGLWVSTDRFVGGHSTDVIGFWNSGWRLSVTSAGHVGIGTADTAGHRLRVHGGSTYLDDKLWAAGGINYGWAGRWRNIQNTWDDRCASIDQGAISDGRFKESVRPIGDAVATLSRLSGVRYRWGAAGLDYFTRTIPESISAGPDATAADHERLWADEHRRTVDRLSGDYLGLVAQDVEAVLPEVVEEAPDGVKRVRYSHLVALLVEAVKEQQAAVERLGTQLRHLEGHPA